MATIRFLKEGEIQRGPAIARRSIDWCVDKLGLKESDRIADLNERNRMIGKKVQIGELRPDRFVLIEINDSDRQDLSRKSWATGYYLIDKEPAEVQRVLSSAKP